MKSNWPAILLGLVLLGTASGAATACKCRQPLPSPRAMLQKSTAVFVGRVLKVQAQRNSQGQRERRATFQLSMAWTGATGRTAVVATNWSVGPCGCPFRQGDEFLVYAFADKSQGKKGLYTNICARTTRLAAAKSDLKALGAGRAVR